MFVGELASLRGLAALVVCIAHTLMVLRLVAHMAHPMPQSQAQVVISVVTVVLSILFRAIIYHTVELPGIALGKRIPGVS